ncbi:MAG: MerR family transcriptional regulator [Rhodoluna sp.]
MSANEASKIFPVRAGKLHTIGRVIEILKPEFPDLSPSKVRFLEEQGLCSPLRTEAGYRKYSDQHVERLKLILELQRDKFLPLRVIKTYLDDLDSGKQPSLPTDTRRPSVNRKFSKLELIAESGITETLLAEAQSHGLIAKDKFEYGDIEIARALMSLQRFGISARHLRGIKSAVDRDLGLIQGVVNSVKKQKDPAAKSRAASYANEIESQFAVIRAELIRAVIDKID